MQQSFSETWQWHLVFFVRFTFEYWFEFTLSCASRQWGFISHLANTKCTFPFVTLVAFSEKMYEFDDLPISERPHKLIGIWLQCSTDDYCLGSQFGEQNWNNSVVVWYWKMCVNSECQCQVFGCVPNAAHRFRFASPSNEFVRNVSTELIPSPSNECSYSSDKQCFTWFYFKIIFMATIHSNKHSELNSSIQQWCIGVCEFWIHESLRRIFFLSELQSSCAARNVCTIHTYTFHPLLHQPLMCWFCNTRELIEQRKQN